MISEIKQFIDQALFHLGTVKELSRKLPEDDSGLDNLIAETVQAAAQKEFVFVLFAAFAAGRKVSARHLAAGTMLMPNWSFLGWSAWHMEGDVAEPLVRAVGVTAFALDIQAMALFVAAAWSQEHRDGKLPDGLMAAARPLARRKVDRPHLAQMLAILRALAALTGDGALAAILAEHHGPPNEIGVKKFMEETLMRFCRCPIEQLIPGKPSNELAHGTTMRRAALRVGRNDPCPCGSGKKYKNCCQEKDRERLRHSSDVAGHTQEEVAADPEWHLTFERMERTMSHEMARFDPKKIPPELLEQYFARLAGCSLYDRIAEAFETLGCSNDLKEVWGFVLFFVTRAGRKDIAERLVKVHPEAATIEGQLPPATRLLLARDEPERWLNLLDTLAREALLTEDSETLEKFAFGIIESNQKALGIFVARSMLPLVNRKDASFLFDRILEARDKLNLSPDDPFGDILDRRFSEGADDESKDAVALRKAQRALEAKAAEVRQLKESFGQLQREIARHEKPAHPAPVMPGPPTDGQPLQELRKKLESLKATLKERHNERNELRRELQKAQDELEAFQQTAAPPAGRAEVDHEEDLLLSQEINGHQPVRLIEFPRGFRETLAGVPRHVARNALAMLGKLAGGEPAAFVGAVRLKAIPEITRQRIGIDHRLLFRLLPDRLQVVDLIPRQDLERRIKTLI